ncbi:MAG: folate-binding protein YgfZ [Rhodospirillales bacterium]|nr:folate-binding protein YgfZ [Rhodospirillales bacterium]
MTSPLCVPLPDRAVLTVGGPDASTFLQGLISNDITRVSPSHAIWAAFLTPQGKYLHDFFICTMGEALLLDVEASRAPDLVRRLTMYKLRSRVSIGAAIPEMAVWALTGPGAAEAFDLPPAEAGTAQALAGGVVFIDPRLADAGARAVLPTATGASPLLERGFGTGVADDYDRSRIALGLPDGSRDISIDKSLLLECGFDELHGIDWQKGCFLGQELTARTRYRGLVKRRLVPMRVEGPRPAPGTPILVGDKPVGEVRSGSGDLALASIRLDALGEISAGEGRIAIGDAHISPQLPSWMRI